VINRLRQEQSYFICLQGRYLNNVLLEFVTIYLVHYGNGSACEKVIKNRAFEKNVGFFEGK
jgi:hypothetical protein